MKMATILGLGWGICFAAVAGGAYADCNPNASSATDPSRYQINADGTVADSRTKLTWQRCPVGYSWSATGSPQCVESAGEQSAFTWDQALQYAAAQAEWRLPNSKELESLVKRNCWAPALEAEVFSSLELSFMWSSTPASAYYGNAWAVQFLDGGVVSVGKSGMYQIRLVRDTQ